MLYVLYYSGGDDDDDGGGVMCTSFFLGIQGFLEFYLLHAFSMSLCNMQSHRLKHKGINKKSSVYMAVMQKCKCA